MHDELPVMEPVDWRRFLQFDAKSVAVLIGCTLFLIGFLAVLPRWLRERDHTDFAGAAVQTAPGKVTAIQISPVSTGGGGLFNGVNLAFGGHVAYFALPPESHWKPRSGQSVVVIFRIGRHSKMVHIDSVTPNNI
ncbi:MAG: hypothetical protein ACRYFS_08025 [Janthinobacterium lividum]